MNNNIIIKTVYILIVILASTSCNDDRFFELERSPQFPWQTVTEYEKSVLGAYSCILANASFATVPEMEQMIDFVESENARFVVGSVANFASLEFNGRSFGTTNAKVDPPFIPCYQAIGECNSALSFYEQNKGNPFPNAKESDRINNVNRIAGELYFLRAYAYFYLVRQYHPPYDPQGKNDYTGLPFRPTLPSSMEECLNPEFFTTAQFYEVIVNDLKKAKQLLPQKYNSTTMHASYQYGRVNKYAASAILARVYMLMGKHVGAESAENEYNFIADNGGYDLEPNVFNNFNRSINNFQNSNKEVIWEFFNSQTQGRNILPAALSHFMKSPYSRSDLDRRSPLFTNTNASSSGARGNNWSFGAWPQYSLSHPVLKNKLKWMNEDGSLTLAAKNDKRYQQLYYYMREYKPTIDKTMGEDTLFLSNAAFSGETKPTIWIDKAFRGFEGRRTNYPVVRFAEVLIHRAAIRFKNGNKKGAADDINRIRKRAWGDKTISYESSLEYLTESNITFDAIANEHIKELSGEGTWILFQQSFRLPIGQPDMPQPAAAVNPPYSQMRWAIPATELMFYNSK